jgi:sensor histidine kinase YesM
MAPASFDPESPRVADAIRGTLRELPPHTRRAVRAVVLVWLALIALQIWDVRDRAGASAAAELVSVLLGTAGFMLLGLVQVLRAAGAPPPDPAPHVLTDRGVITSDEPAVRRILMALPSVGVAVVALMAAAIALSVARVWLGASPVVFLITIIYVVALAAGVVVVGDSARRLYEHGQQQAARAGRMEAQLADARLAALQAQMNPHFLFNALNTVAALTRTDPRAAERTVENLSEVLRTTLEKSPQVETTLADEMRFVSAYLSIERQRFGDRLAVDWQAAPEILSAIVPPFSVQPLVENALKHGVSPRAQGGRLTVSAARSGDRLRIAVEDDGEGFDGRYREGTGLGNLRRRLEVLYGPAATISVDRAAPGGRVVLELPFMTAGVTDASADR